MTINLSSYSAIESGLFVKLTCDYYRTTANDSYTTQVLRFSDINRPLTINGESYVGLGRLLGITQSSSELRVSRNELTISISGIPNTSIAEIIHSRLKGSSIVIYRGVYNPTNGQLLNITGNPTGRFTGVVTNYSLSEEYDNQSRTAKNTISLICASMLDVLSNTSKGRRTNPDDEKKFYPLDISMDRVPALVGQYYNFGAA